MNGDQIRFEKRRNRCGEPSQLFLVCIRQVATQNWQFGCNLQVHVSAVSPLIKMCHWNPQVYLLNVTDPSINFPTPFYIGQREGEERMRKTKEIKHRKRERRKGEKKKGRMKDEQRSGRPKEARHRRDLSPNVGINLGPVSYTHLTLPTNREV